ncbi:uncharacterized protein C9orf85 homolog [Ruditapes philippinarum]|uniref:uncharacterized protein C9orf85 homolog n=1 Tax=Ruditapes philippinarum TaxID=129788 RepID=UPI00295B8898|nr:uncharacterized protein C9orf85 homolog [Ruditapes philippinarum]XP_060572289.1 uncharacterized protein C9orf85 homolog [Ruditapes philippinarum]XP_060572290.1 uncharacterized protein C9orf85 homolog [Ruditapes philippinarum]
MSSQRGNVQKSRAPKYQNKSAFKNVYHDTSKKTQQIVSTVVSGVCSRCKDCIDWKIKYKKYKPLTQPKTCVICKQKTVKQAYHVMCNKCSADSNKCAKCGEKKQVVIKPKLSEAEQAVEDRELQFELEQLPERKRRTFLRLQEKGQLNGMDADNQFNGSDKGFDDDDAESGDEDDDVRAQDDMTDSSPMNTEDCNKQFAEGTVRNETEKNTTELNSAPVVTKVENDNKPVDGKEDIDVSKLAISASNEND